MSVFVPLVDLHAVPGLLSDETTWSRFAGLRDRVDADPDALADVRAVLGPVERRLWAEPTPHLEGAAAAERLARDVTRLGRRVRSRSESLARQFDRVLRVLESWGYVDGWDLTPAGRLLMRINAETDLLVAAGETGKPVSIKKGQFMAPWDMKNVVDKAKAVNGGLDNIMVCERGVTFGYNNLVADMRSLAIMRETGCPVVFDATHSVQLPGGQGSSSGGQREFVPVLSRAAVAVGISGLFMETHPDPAKAMSDGPNAVPLNHLKELLVSLQSLDQVVKQSKTYLENQFAGI